MAEVARRFISISVEGVTELSIDDRAEQNGELEKRGGRVLGLILAGIGSIIIWMER